MATSKGRARLFRDFAVREVVRHFPDNFVDLWASFKVPPQTTTVAHLAATGAFWKSACLKDFV